MVAALSLIALLAQGPKPFKANATIGQFVKIGSTIIQGGRVQDWGNQQKIALNAARIDVAYPFKNRVILAEPDSKLLVMSVTLLNTSTTQIVVGGDRMPTVCFWDPKGQTQFRLVNYIDPKTQKLPVGQLKTGKSAAFDIVVQIPSHYDDFRLGLGWGRLEMVAWYDLRTKMGKTQSIFSPNGLQVENEAEAKAKTPFDLGPVLVTVDGLLEESDRRGSVATAADVKVIAVKAQNTQSAPCRWGWQYVEASLVLEDGTKVGAYPGVFKRESGDAWIDDLNPGQTAEVQFVFSTASTQKPKTLNLKWLETNRTAKVRLDGPLSLR